MKRRVIETRKILAVALGAAAGCTSATSGDLPAAGVNTPPAQVAPPVLAGPQAPFAPGTLGDPARVPHTPPETRSPPPPAAAPVSPPPERHLSQDPALLALREDLAHETRGQVHNPDRFLPLCDKDGYPLVGNVMRKSPSPDYQPSAFCADLRAQARR
jgi:hypothetical protein